MKHIRKWAPFFGIVLAVSLLTSPAHALNLSPANYDWTTNITSNLNSTNIGTITGFTGLSLLYKSDFEGGEDRSLQSSYHTTFSSPGGASDGPSAFTVSYVSGAFASCPTCIFVVKDGNHAPSQYLFNLGSWTGKEQINGSGFWLNGGGAISNVAIWGSGSSVPEPASLMLLGTALAGVGISRRRFNKS
jgi:hypothetical protein